MKKKLVLITVIISLVAIMVAGATLAFFTAEKTAENVFTVGTGVGIDLDEPEWVPSDSDVVPGKEISKDPTVTVTGETPCYVRFKVEVTEREAIDEIIANMVARGETFDPAACLGGFTASDWDVEVDRDSDPNSTIYYLTYNQGALEKDETVTVFTSVIIPENLASSDFYHGGEIAVGEEIAISSFNINVTAQAIQAEGFADAAEAFVAFDAE